MALDIASRLKRARELASPTAPGQYADPVNKAFPLSPVRRITVAHSYIHKYFSDKAKTGVTATYPHEKFIQVHNKIVRAMIDNNIVHHLCDALDDTLPTALKNKSVKGEMAFGVEAGELCQEEIKIAPKIDIGKLTEGDEKPFFVTAKALKTGISRNKKRYSKEILEKFLAQLPLYGYLGHISEKDIGTTFRNPVTIWIGGEIQNDWLYVKGYIPPEEESLRKKVALSLKTRPMPVSVLGFYQLRPAGEISDVLDIQALSIDWANPGLEGVEGAGVVNISRETKEDKMITREEVLASLTLDDIQKERSDLIEMLRSEMQESDEEKKKREDEEKKIKTLEKENAEIKKAMIDTHREKLLAEITNEEVRAIAGDLLQGETKEELDTNWKLVKEKLAKIEKPGMPIITGANTSKPGSEFIEERLL